MGILELKGHQSINAIDSAVDLIVRGEPWGVLLDVKLFPLQCPVCDFIFPNLFEHRGSRYGHVGQVVCKCGEELNLTDSDNIVEYIEIHTQIGKRTQDFRELYNLTSEDFQVLNQKYNYDIFQKHAGERISLLGLVDELEKITGIVAKSEESEFPTPISVKKWKWLVK
jgi:hypothetical protein